MCVYSMVYDYFTPEFDKWVRPISPQPKYHTKKETDDLVKRIKDFVKAKEAAQVVDELTDQKDCVDPAKQKLDERVAELEKQVAELTKAKPKKKKKTTKKK